MADVAAADASNGPKAAVVAPNALTEDKAVENTEKAINTLKPIVKSAEAKPVAIDTGNGHAPAPTITISDHDTEPQLLDKSGKQQNGVNAQATTFATPPSDAVDNVNREDTDPTAAAPGSMPSKPAGELPDWYANAKVGWRQVTGIDDPTPTAIQAEKNVIHAWLNDMYYGDWYHNAGVIVVAVLATHLATLLRLGMGWIFIILAFCASYYSNSIQRFRTRAREDIQRELLKKKLAHTAESADWMNEFLERFWKIYEPVLSKSIGAAVEQVLSYSTPSFLDSLKLGTFTFGTTAPHIVSVKTDPFTPDDTILMDWAVKFTPTDMLNITPAQAKLRTNPKIVLDVKVGKGPAVATLPILVEDMTFAGKMRIRMKLMQAFPHVKTVEMSFTEKPVFDYVLKPIGGETFGFDIGNIPGLSAFIRETVHSILAPMMYEPNVFTLNLEQLLSGVPIDTAVGVLQIHLVSGKNIKGSKIGGGTPDPYVSISINNRAPLARTGFRPSTINPHWGSTHFVLLNQANLNETLTLSVMDHNEHRKDTSLGQVNFDLTSILEDATQEGLVKEIMRDGKERGELQFDISYFPVITPAVVDGKPEPLPESNVGICRLTIHQAKDLDRSRSLASDLNPVAKVFLSGAKTPHVATHTVKHTLAPVWETPTEFLVPNKKRSTVTIKVINERDFMKDPVVGYMTVRLEDLLTATQKRGRENCWWVLSGCNTGRVRISAEWKPLNMAGSLQGAGTYTPPIGLVRLWIKRAKDVKNVESTLGGKSDPYVRVMLNGVIKSRTDIINNNLNPEFDQIIYVPVHHLRETLVLEVMDYQNIGKDRSLGAVELKVNDLAVADRDNHDFPYTSNGKIPRNSPIFLDKNISKGFLEYEAEFVPSLNIKGIEFDERNELEKAVEEGARESGAHGNDGDDVASADGSVSSSDEEYEKVPEGITVGEPSTPTTPLTPSAPLREPDQRDTDTTKNGTTVPSGRNKSASPERGSVEISREQLLHTSSGILIFNVKSGKIFHKARLEVLLDDSYWPSFATERARSSAHAKWDAIGEGFVKELDFGRVWLRLNENDEGEKEDILGDFKCDTKAFLERSLDTDAEFTLSREDGTSVGSVVISSKFVPVPIKLDPRESINNMGVLRVDLMSGKDIRGADRSGKSDPFVVFTLNGRKVHKSETKKKTLAPEWNESFPVQVPSRVAADFTLEVFDWNQIEQAKSLGVGRIELADVEPFQSMERVIPITSPKHGEKGEILLRLLFTPEIIAKARKNTSTFSTAGRAMTQLGGLPLGAGKGVVHGVGSVGRHVTGVFKRSKSIKESDESDVEPPPAQVSMPAGPNASPAAAVAAGTTIPPTQDTIPQPNIGVVKVVVVGAKDLSTAGESSVKPYLVLRVGKEKFKTKHAGKTLTPEWDETFSFQVTPDIRTMSLGIYDDKSFAKDKCLGEADIEIWRHLQPNAPTPLLAADVWTELRNGTGQVHIRLEYERGLGHGRSSTNLSTSRAMGLGSPSRFSLHKPRPTDE
ncbi:hypothetical protein FS837_008089 [Tulasnella sp. UAMH 9824]|nr:hypothetical protein FS837_008089 [Tulasnella sp. UAMH 9824]